MPHLIIPRKNKLWKPGGFPEVDWSHPLSIRLWRAFLLGPEYPNYVFDATRRDLAAPTVTGTLTGFAAGRLGVGLESIYSHYIQHASRTSTSGITNKCTAAVWIRYTTRGVYVEQGAAGVGDYGFHTYRVGWNFGSGSYWLSNCRFKMSTGTYQALSGAREMPYDQKDWHLIVATYDGSASPSQCLYLDGVLDASSSTLSGNLHVGTGWPGDYLRSCGCYATSETGTFHGAQLTHWVWTRCLSAAEVFWLYSEPFALLRDAPRRVYFISAGGAQPQSATAGIADATAAGLGPTAANPYSATAGLAAADAAGLGPTAENPYSATAGIAEADANGLGPTASNPYTATAGIATVDVIALGATRVTTVTEILDPTSVDTDDDWTLGAGSDKVSAVNRPDDADTSYVYDTTSGQKQRYVLEDPSAIGPQDTIESVTVTVRARRIDTSAGFRVGLQIGANTDQSDRIYPNSSYGDWTFGPRTTKPGGGSWTLQDLKDLQVYLYTDLTIDCAVTTLYVTVTSQPTGISVTAGIATVDAVGLGLTSSNPYTATAGIAVIDAVGLGPSSAQVQAVGIATVDANGLGPTASNPYSGTVGIALVDAVGLGPTSSEAIAVTAGIAEANAVGLAPEALQEIVATAGIAAAEALGLMVTNPSIIVQRHPTTKLRTSLQGRRRKVLGNQGYLGLRESLSAGTKEARIQAPETLTEDYALTLPGALPTATAEMRVSSAGLVSTWVPVTLESAEFTFDGTGQQTCQMAHGLSYTPSAKNIALSWMKTGGSDPILRDLGVLSVDATNINVYLYCPAWVSQFKLKVLARVFPE